jgi:lipopolysaccharide export system permease protein
MKLIDKYILKQFLTTFFFVVIILLAVISVIDMTDKMEKFAKANLTAGDILGYYGNYIPWIGSLITPITIFIATVYVCARMAGRTEIIAILSAGVSFRRLLVPFFAGSAVVAIISFVLSGWIIPNSNKSRLAFEVQHLKGRFYYDKRNIHLQVAPDIYMYLQSYNNTTHTGYHFSLERFENNRLVEKMTGSRIEWDTAKLKWTVRDFEINKIDEIFERTGKRTARDVREPGRGLRTSRTGASLDTALVIQPKEFESDYRKYDGMTINELTDYIDTLRARGSAGVEVYEVEKYTRYAYPFTIFILVFMGVIVSSRKSRGGTGVQIALGFTLSFIFILFFTLFRTFAENGQWPPEISVWIPNLIFGVLSLFMYKYTPR